ncbi:D-alanine--D-alanine ligase [bacterium]|nr:D-alanine--D-alanine ligase [bacterium]
MDKQTVIILCGGESGEHEVSLQSANSIIQYIPRDRYQVIPVGISKKGDWLTGDPLFKNEDDPSNISLADGLKSVRLEKGMLDGRKIDAVFPVIHGTYGEDGCLQGLLQMHHVPFVGAGVLGSAIGMDKDVMKRLLIPIGINCARHRVIHHWQKEWPSYEEVSRELGKILFIKPCNLGSSIGISKCRNEREYEKAVGYAFEFDRKIIVEEFIKGREIEISVLGNENVTVSVPGEIIPGEEFYSYDSKYIDSDKTQLKIPAELEPSVEENLKEIARRAFIALELEGLARIDFFVKSNGEVWLNEANTLPGFTKISMYPKLWEYSGLAYSELIHRLIQLAIDRFKIEEKLKRNKV